MRRHKNILIFLILIAIISCSEHSRKNIELHGDSLKIEGNYVLDNLKDSTIHMLDRKAESIYQLSFQHNSNALYDSVVLTNSLKENSGLFNKISIFRQKKLIFEYTDKNLEVLGMPYSLFVEKEVIFQKEYFYVFKLFGAPGPDRWGVKNVI